MSTNPLQTISCILRSALLFIIGPHPDIVIIPMPTPRTTRVYRDPRIDRHKNAMRDWLRMSGG
jgi:hypothetical protein